MMTKRWGNISTNLTLLCVSVLMLGPLFLILNISLKSNKEYLNTPLSIVKTPNFHNYVEAWQQAEMHVYFMNSVIYAFTIAAGTCILAALAAYPISRNHMRGANFLYLMFLSALFLPGGLVPLLFLMKYLGFMNTYHGYILLKIAGSLPVSVFIFNGFIKGIPRELDEAAEMDGCGYLRYIFTFVFPLMKPSFMTLGMLIVIGTWNDFIGPYLFLIDKELRPLTAGLYMFMGQYSVNWTILSAGIIIVAIPLIVGFVFLQRYIISGITSGAIKG